MYYSLISCDLIIAVVDTDPLNLSRVGGKSEPVIYWWDGLDKERQAEARKLPRWDINHQAWLVHSE